MQVAFDLRKSMPGDFCLITISVIGESGVYSDVWNPAKLLTYCDAKNQPKEQVLCFLKYFTPNISDMDKILYVCSAFINTLI